MAYLEFRYQQCEVMSTHYKIPILLIEFDQKKSFSLETYSDVKGNTHQNSDTDLHSKLVLLTLTFPRLRIIWSSSPYATADIYADLKQNRDEPDAAKAAALGADAADAAAGEAEAVINQTPQDLLRSLPGIVSCDSVD
jgi:DNA excision repair protein ERCC-4